MLWGRRFVDVDCDAKRIARGKAGMEGAKAISMLWLKQGAINPSYHKVSQIRDRVEIMGSSSY